MLFFGIYYIYIFASSVFLVLIFFSSRRRHTICALVTWSSDVCSSDLRERKQQKTRLFYRKESVIRTLGRSPPSLGKGPPCPNVRNVRIVRNVRAGHPRLEGVA